MAEEGRLGPPEFLAYRVLRRLKEQSDRQISRGKFLKLCCIADRYLKEKGVRIGFPRYWYKYGEIASENDFSSDHFYKSAQAVGYEGRRYRPNEEIESEWEDQAQFTAETDRGVVEPAQGIQNDDFDVDGQTRHQINESVRWVVHKFGEDDVGKIKRHQYKNYSPKEFIRTYSDLRWHLEETDLERQARLHDNQPKGQTGKEFVEMYLDSMVMEYPDVFDDMYRLYLRWDDTTRLMLKHRSSFSEINAFLDSFIDTLSKAEIRFFTAENISGERFEDWQESAEERKEKFEMELQKKREELLLKEDKFESFESVSEPFEETVLDDLNDLRQTR